MTELPGKCCGKCKHWFTYRQVFGECHVDLPEWILANKGKITTRNYGQSCPCFTPKESEK